MFTFSMHRMAFVLLMLFVASGCSKNAEVESVLDRYYKAAEKHDMDKLSEYIDYSMFKLTTASHRVEMQEQTSNLIAGMNEFSNANGGFQKVKITEVKEFVEGQEKFLLVTHDLLFKNGRAITNKVSLSRPDGKLKILMINNLPW